MERRRFPIRISLAVLVIVCSLSLSKSYAQDNVLFLGLKGSYEDLWQAEKDNVSSSSAPGFSGYSIMAQLIYDAGKRFRLETGIGYSRKSYEYGYRGYILNDQYPAIATKALVDQYFVRIPIMLGVRTLSRKFDIVPSVGIQYEFFVKRTNRVEYEDGSVRDGGDQFQKNLSSVWFSLRSALAFEYNFDQKIKTFISPTAYYHVIGTYDFPSSDTFKPLGWGIDLGVAYRL